jgi:hypothetical protein
MALHTQAARVEDKSRVELMKSFLEELRRELRILNLLRYFPPAGPAGVGFQRAPGSHASLPGVARDRRSTGHPPKGVVNR